MRGESGPQGEPGPKGDTGEITLAPNGGLSQNKGGLLLSPLKLLYNGAAHGYGKAVLRDDPSKFRSIHITTSHDGWCRFATFVPATLPRNAPWRIKIEDRMALSFETRDPQKPHQWVKTGEMVPGQEWELRSIYGAE